MRMKTLRKRRKMKRKRRGKRRKRRRKMMKEDKLGPPSLRIVKDKSRQKSRTRTRTLLGHAHTRTEEDSCMTDRVVGGGGGGRRTGGGRGGRRGAVKPVMVDHFDSPNWSKAKAEQPHLANGSHIWFVYKLLARPSTTGPDSIPRRHEMR
ncbi:hypothetical protein L3Q82_026732 [Scortum barcoo]|uniref:Uncharacterized protein n=1 Tax=Scortum barcoo TaxID=214431 RepID=A0ACB8WJG9_9TELE|nr:hypothetical protein L3Q82_026732 [Scortum barcoo]